MTPLDAVRSWLLSAEARPLLATHLVEQLAVQLAPHVPVWRMGTGLMTMHPDVAVVVVHWTAEEGVQAQDMAVTDMQAGMDGSPILALVESGEPMLRIRLDGPTRFGLLERFREQGATDYVILHLPGQRDQMFSFTTRQPGGFTEAQLDLLLGLRDALSIRLDLLLARHISWSLLRAYLGQNAASRVLSGEYHRGDGERLDTIVFTCDLRGFTARVDECPLPEVLDDLDRFFEHVSEPWIDRGGEILKFIGDAVLGIFPTDAGPEAAVAALDAARESFARIAVDATRLTPGRRPLKMGYVLHAGEVMYGNIGSRTRIDFTVVGGTVNEASRMEALTKTLAPLILSERFAARLPDRSGLRDLGAHPLRGVAHPMRMFTAPVPS